MAKRTEDDIKNERLSQKLREEQAKLLSVIEEKNVRIGEIISRTYQTETERNNALEDAKKLEKEIFDIIEDIDAIEDRSVKTKKRKVDLIKEQFDIEEKLEKTLGEQNFAKDLHAKAQERITGSTKEYKEVADIAAMILEKQAQITKRAVYLQQQGLDLSQSFVSSLESGVQVSNTLKDISGDISNSIKDATDGQYKTYDFSKASAAIDARRLTIDLEREAIAGGMGTMDAEELKLLEEQLDADVLHLRNLKEQDDVLKLVSEQAKTTLGVYNKMLDLDFGGAIREKFGFDSIQKDIKEKVGHTLVNIVKELKGGGGLTGAFSAAGTGLKELSKLAKAFTLALGVGAILMLGKFLIDTFMEADKEVAQLGKDFGISKNEAKELHHAAVDVADEMRITGIHSEHVAKSLKTVSDNLGGIDLTGAFASGNAAVQQMVKDTAILTEKFGLSAEEAGNLSNISGITGKSVGELTMMSTKLGNGIFSAKESMKILAGIPKSVVSSMSKMPEAMIKTAMHAKMLGLNMKQIADIGRKSLDIESSLEAEMEARALIGRDINLDKMRAAALDGDQETVMKELLNAAGSMDQFNKMNVLQKEALAKAAGMEVDQMAEMLGKQEELNKAGLSQSKVEELQKKNAADLAKLAATETSENKKAYLEKLAAEKKSEETQAAMADLMKRLQELAVKLVTPIMDVVDGLLQGEEGASAMDGILNVVGTTVKGISYPIKWIAQAIGFLIKPLTWILGLFSSTEEKTEEVAHAAGNVAKGVQTVGDKVKPLTAGFGSLLGVVTTIGGFFAGKALLGKGMDLLTSKAGDLGKTLLSKVGGPLGKIGGKLFGGGDSKEEAGGGDKASVAEAEKGKNMVSGVLDKIKSIIDSIKGVVQSAIGFVRDVGKDLLATLNDIVKGIGDILATGADIVVNVGSKLAEGAMKILNIIMKGLASAAATLPGIMASLGAAVVAFFTPMAALVNPMVIAGIAIFVGAIIGLGYAFKLLGEGIGAAAPGITAFFEGVGAVIEKVGDAIAKIIETITTSVIRLQDIDGEKLLTTAKGIAAIGIAMAGLGAGKAAEGFGSFIGSIFGGGDPMEKLISFTDRIKPEKLAETANALKGLTTTFGLFASGLEKMAATLDKLDLGKLDSAIEKLERAKSLSEKSVGEGIASAATSFVGGITSIVGGIFGGSEEQKSQTVSAKSDGGNKGGDKLDQVIGILSQILNTTNQPTVIKFGEKTVEEIKTQLNFKKAYNIGVDKGYGKTI